MDKTTKKRLDILNLLHKFEVEIEGTLYYVFYNEEDIKESEALKLIMQSDLTNKHLIVVTKEQYETVICDYKNKKDKKGK